ncbi:uncharacterized protein LOC62_04G006110 [Vanrija pseudolonga]|uniref:Wax synthase domain-containing protein n=1 Tax=Vanrija pseudolonga TaxID=143232 RepID=A0AAF0Y9Y3_9TREE|nr:hypothetical protein LOC62_04G006110 [Vanrija pseudolonga]
MSSFFAPPFGPLNGIHYLIQHHARPLKASSAVDLLEALIPLYAQAFLLLSPSFLGPSTRLLRATLGLVGILSLTNQFMSWRVVPPGANALNTTLGSLYVHTVLKYAWFALAPGATDTLMFRAGRKRRSRAFAALDLCLNSRYTYVEFEPREEESEKAAAGRRSSRSPSPPDRPTFPYTLSTASRAPVVMRHLLLGFLQILAADTLLAIVRAAGPSTLGDPNSAQGKIATFLATTGFEVIPGIIDPCGLNENRVELRQSVIEVLITLALGAAPYLTMNGLYRLAAGLAIGSRLWEVESWEPDLFDSPWAADSLLDFWRRWHGINKHDHALLRDTLLDVAGLPHTPFLTIPITFIISGLLHIVYQLGMNPVPAATKVGGFFVACAVGTFVEYSVYRATGSYVGGIIGRVWTWSFLYLAAGRYIVDAWVDAGVAATRLAEDDWADALAVWILKYVLVPYAK